MIDYSVFMMGNPMDVDAAQKAYAKAQVSEIMPFSQFVKHIADHNGVFTRGTVKGVIYNPQIQISVVSGTKRSIFRQKNKTKRSKKRLHTTLIKPEQKVNEDLCSGFIVS